MDIVRQEKIGQCGAACLAMVMELPLASVVADLEERVGAPLEEIGLADGDLADYMRWAKFASHPEIVLDWDGQEPAILTVPSLNHRGMLHYIVWDGERYLDPSSGELTYPNDAPMIGGRRQVCWTTAVVWGRENP